MCAGLRVSPAFELDHEGQARLCIAFEAITDGPQRGGCQTPGSQLVVTQQPLLSPLITPMLGDAPCASSAQQEGARSATGSRPPNLDATGSGASALEQVELTYM